MNNISRQIHTLTLPALLLLIVLASCVPQKKIRYFQDMSGSDTTQTHFVNDRGEEYQVNPGDNLYIRILSIDDRAYSFEEARGATNYYQESGIYLNSYGVDEFGNIEFPLIGKIKVENLTTSQIKDSLQMRVDEYVKNTTVIVKLANFRITLLGEFQRPGKYLVYQDKINIFEAIGLAGDMTDFAKRNRTLLIRQTEDGFQSVRLDLNDRAIVESEYFYLQPNDMVYVEPVRGKQFTFIQFPYALIFSAITTTLLLIEYFGN
jgi:polysaccharide export outer membrane protein